MFLWVFLQHSAVGYITQSELVELDPDFAESFTESFCDQDAVFKLYRTLSCFPDKNLFRGYFES